MTLKIIPFVLGPLTNNTYLLVDEASGEAIVIDPSFGIKAVIDELDRHQWKLSRILLTHAHFDHVAGVPALVQVFHPAPLVELHADDAPLYAANGNAELFGFHIDPLPPISHELKHQGVIKFGNTDIEVRHAPGHTAGHVIFYISKLATAAPICPVEIINCLPIVFVRKFSHCPSKRSSSAGMGRKRRSALK